MDKKVLIVYYSLEGNTKKISERIAKELTAELLEVKPKKDISSNNFKKYLWGGKQVIFKQQPELMPINVSINNFDVIIIGTPVWAGSYAPAIRSFLNQYTFNNKKIALFCTHEGGKGKIFNNFKKILETNNTILDTMDLNKVFKPSAINDEKINTFCINIKNSLN